jgi:hypothetical protein
VSAPPAERVDSESPHERGGIKIPADKIRNPKQISNDKQYSITNAQNNPPWSLYKTGNYFEFGSLNIGIYLEFEFCDLGFN